MKDKNETSRIQYVHILMKAQEYPSLFSAEIIIYASHQQQQSNKYEDNLMRDFSFDATPVIFRVTDRSPFVTFCIFGHIVTAIKNRRIG